MLARLEELGCLASGSRDLTLAAAGGAALVGLVALTAAAGTGNDASGTGSSFSNRPDGARAAYLTLRQLGYRVARSHEPLARSMPTRFLTVLVSPARRPGSQTRTDGRSPRSPSVEASRWSGLRRGAGARRRGAARSPSSPTTGSADAIGRAVEMPRRPDRGRPRDQHGAEVRGGD
jgi:hypothetical protein